MKATLLHYCTSILQLKFSGMPSLHMNIIHSKLKVVITMAMTLCLIYKTSAQQVEQLIGYRSTENIGSYYYGNQPFGYDSARIFYSGNADVWSNPFQSYLWLDLDTIYNLLMYHDWYDLNRYYVKSKTSSINTPPTGNMVNENHILAFDSLQGFEDGQPFAMQYQSILQDKVHEQILNICPDFTDCNYVWEGDRFVYDAQGNLITWLQWNDDINVFTKYSFTYQNSLVTSCLQEYLDPETGYAEPLIVNQYITYTYNDNDQLIERITTSGSMELQPSISIKEHISYAGTNITNITESIYTKTGEWFDQTYITLLYTESGKIAQMLTTFYDMEADEWREESIDVFYDTDDNISLYNRYNYYSPIPERGTYSYENGKLTFYTFESDALYENYKIDLDYDNEGMLEYIYYFEPDASYNLYQNYHWTALGNLLYYEVGDLNIAPWPSYADINDSTADTGVKTPWYNVQYYYDIHDPYSTAVNNEGLTIHGFQNMTGDIFELEIYSVNNADDFHVSVSSISGQTVLNAQIAGDQTEKLYLDCSRWATGIYIISVQTSNTSATLKAMIY